MFEFMGKINELKQDDGINQASALLQQGTAGLTQADAEALALFAVQSANMGALKGKIPPAGEIAISKAIVIIGKSGIRLFGGLFKGKK